MIIGGNYFKIKLMSLKVLFLFFMIFMHIVDDYYMQGILANLKQKSWWIKNAPKEKLPLYKNDYIVALACHAFSWSFMIHIPTLLYVYKIVSYSDTDLINIEICIVIMAIVHAIVDNEKANRYRINLVTDQFIHFMQICFSWYILIVK